MPVTGPESPSSGRWTLPDRLRPARWALPDRLRPARWALLGLAGTILFGVSATLAGALPDRDPGAGFREGWLGAVPASFTIGLLCWVLGAVLLGVAWLRLPPLGGGQTVLIGLLWALPLLITPPLGSRDIYAYACQGWLWSHGRDPYALGVAEGGCPWTASVPEIWWDTPTPYGPLAVLLSGIAASFGSQLAAVIALRLLALVAAALLAWQLPRLAVACGSSPALACRLGLVTPLVLVHGLSAAHNDLLVAALLITALALPVTAPARTAPPVESRPSGSAGTAPPVGLRPSGSAGTAPPVGLRPFGSAGAVRLWSRESRRGGGLARVVGAGALVAAAVAIKVTAIVALPFLLLMIGRRWWAALAAALASFAALSLATGLGLGWVAALRSTGELAQWSSPPTAVGMTVGYLLRLFGVDSAAPVTIARAVGIVALVAIALWSLRHAWRHRHHPATTTVACGLTLAATALLGPVFYPWYALTPLAVLAATIRSEPAVSDVALSGGSTDVAASREARPGPQRTSAEKLLLIGTLVCTFLTLPNGLGVPVLTKAVGAFAVTGVLIWLVVRLFRRRGPARVV